MEKEADGRWVAWETPLEIDEEEPLEVVVWGTLGFGGGAGADGVGLGWEGCCQFWKR